MRARAEKQTVRAWHDGELAVELRKAETSDGIAMWRMASGRASSQGLSAFFYMALIQHFGQIGTVIERDGESIGYVIAPAPRAGGVVRILDLFLRAPNDTGEMIFVVLSALLRLPAYRHGEHVEPAPSCDPGVCKALRELLGTGLAKRSAVRDLYAVANG